MPLLENGDVEYLRGSLWEKQAYRFPNGGAAVRGLFTAEDARSCLLFSPLAEKDLRVVFRGVTIESRNYRQESGAVRFDQIEELLAGGASFNLNAVQRWSLHLEAETDDLEHRLAIPLSVNYYETPPNSSALGAHFDTHSILVAQVQGSKHWRTGGMRVEKPILGLHPTSVKLDDQLAARFTLDEGDLFYLPRGLEHDAWCTTSSSCHLTLGLHPTTYSSLLREGLKQCATDQVFLRQVVDPEDLRQNPGLLTSLLGQLSGWLEGTILARTTKPVSVCLMAPRDRSCVIVAESSFRVAENFAFTSERGHLALHGGPRQTPFPLRTWVAPALREIASRTEFQLDELSELKPAKARLLCQYLWINGLLERP